MLRSTSGLGHHTFNVVADENWHRGSNPLRSTNKCGYLTNRLGGCPFKAKMQIRISLPVQRLRIMYSVNESKRSLTYWDNK